MTCSSKRNSHTTFFFISIVLLIIIAGPVVFAFYIYNTNVIVQACADKAGRVCLTAENAKPSRRCELIIAGNSEGFDPGFTGRKSFNTKKLTGNSPADFYIVDRSENLLMYTHFVKVRKTCLSCHGDPSKSKKLWVNLENSIGRAPELIGWAEGDICGAYEVTAPLAGSTSATAIAGTILISGFGIYAVALWAVAKYALRERRKSGSGSSSDKEITCLDSEIYDFDQPEKEDMITQTSQIDQSE